MFILLPTQEHIERLVATAEEKADEVARSNGQEIQREEETELQLPFLLPEDGYSCDVIRGVPPGLQGFLEPLANTGLCRLTIQPETSGLWTVYQKKHMEASKRKYINFVINTYIPAETCWHATNISQQSFSQKSLHY